MFIVDQRVDFTNLLPFTLIRNEEQIKTFYDEKADRFWTMQISEDSKMTQMLDSQVMPQRAYLFTPYSATFLAVTLLAREKEMPFQEIEELLHDTCSSEDDHDKR